MYALSEMGKLSFIDIVIHSWVLINSKLYNCNESSFLQVLK